MMSAIPGLGTLTVFKVGVYTSTDGICFFLCADPVAANGNADMALGPSPFVMNVNYTSSLYGSDVHTMPNMSPYHAPTYLPPENIPTPSLSPVNALRASPLSEPSEQLIQYYFDNVRKLQFAFAGPELAQTLWHVSTFPSPSPRRSFFLSFLPFWTMHAINLFPRELLPMTS